MTQQFVVRDVVATDVRKIAVALARAFYDDPLASWIIPDDDKRMAVEERLYAAMLTVGLRRPHGTMLTTPDAVAAAMWTPPGVTKPPASVMLSLLPEVLKSIRAIKLSRFLAVSKVETASKPKEPHWYLAGIGTDPDSQGRGIATALMRPILDRCDAERIGAFLLTQKERNVPFYEGRGFRVTSETDLPKGGPHLWMMWRDPQ